MSSFIASLLAVDWEYLSAFAALTALAVLPIYTGSRSSLTYPKIGRVPSSHPGDVGASDSDDDVDREYMTLEDAYWFPVFGSAALLSLYFIFRYVDRFYLDIFIAVVFSALGSFNLLTVVLDFATYCLPTDWISGTYRIVIYDRSGIVARHKFGIVQAISLALSITLCIIYGVSKHWFVTNILSLSFAYSAITLLTVDQFATGIVLLSCLFIYDIFWVFGTEVMVSVARNFDAPIKILWPRIISAIFSNKYFNTDPSNLRLLGLGDIVIPGIYVALCLKFDHYLYLKTAKGKKALSRSFPKPYFYTVLIAYILGLFTTYFVMITFNASQPALLYLSPACILSSISVAVVQGQLKEFFNFSANPDSPPLTKEVPQVLSTLSESPIAKRIATLIKDAVSPKKHNENYEPLATLSDADESEPEEEVAPRSKSRGRTPKKSVASESTKVSSKSSGSSKSPSSSKSPARSKSRNVATPKKGSGSTRATPRKSKA